MDVDQQMQILLQAASGSLPESIDSTSAIPVQIVQELISSGHLEAVDVSSFDGAAFLDPRITTSGREHLRILEERARSRSLAGKTKKVIPAAIKWTFGILAVLIASFLTNRFVG